MKLGRNLIAGLSNSIWSALLGLAVVPFYLKYLGIEAYGLMGFFATTQALLQILDMGMAPTINREVARCNASGNLREAGKLLHTLALVYWSMALVIAILIFVLAPWIAGYWLQSKQLSAQTVSYAVMLMGLVVACRWPIGLYQGAVIGAQRITVSSGISLVMTTIGSLGGLMILAYVSPTIEAFFIWQACVSLFYTIILRAAAWRIVGKQTGIRFDIIKLQSIWRFTAGMSGVGLTALVFTQLDKIILSKLLGLAEFGHYMLAITVVTSLSILIGPLFNVIYPQFCALVVIGDTNKLKNLYRWGTRILAMFLFPIAMALAVFSENIIIVWTGNPGLASSVAPLISLLVIGSALNGVMYFPYALQLSYGMTWIPLAINLVLMCFLVPLLIYLTSLYGALGGAMAWLISQVVYVISGPWLTHRFVLKGLGLGWFFEDVGIPFGVSTLVGVVGYFGIQKGGYSVYQKLIWAVGLVVLSSTLIVLMTKPLRRVVWNYARQKKCAI